MSYSDWEGTPLGDAMNERCDAVATAAVEEASSYAMGACGNSGQEGIMSSVMDDIYGSGEDIYWGVWADSIETGHPEAVGEITEVVNTILQAASEECKMIRDTLTWADI